MTEISPTHTMGTNPRTVHTGLNPLTPGKRPGYTRDFGHVGRAALTHTVQNSSLQTNGGGQVHVLTWGTRYSENFTLEKSHFTFENPSKFSSRSRENGTKNLI